MANFATRFPIRNNITNSEFSDLAIEWLNGVKKSSVLENAVKRQMYDDDARIEGGNGELFCLKSVEYDDCSAIGLRHEMPDEQRRIWRTECVITRRQHSSWVSFKADCILQDADAKLIAPKKPFLIKLMLKNGWGGSDNSRAVTNAPYFLNEDDLHLANKIILGEETSDLPFVYVSRDDNDQTIIDTDELAFQLGGMAHVYIEPSRKFSIDLMNSTFRRNPYGGNLALCAPSKGVLKKFYFRDSGDTDRSIADAVIKAISKHFSHIDGRNLLDWQALQERQSRKLRKAFEAELKSRSTTDDENNLNNYINAFDEEMLSKNQKIEELENKIDALDKELSLQENSGMSWASAKIINSDLDELYSGEASDRIRATVAGYIKGKLPEKTPRHMYVLKSLIEDSQPTGRSTVLEQQIKSAGRDVSTMVVQISSLLNSFGYVSSQEGKHIKFIPPEKLGGLSAQTCPKTPSDYRAGKNKAKDIIQDFSIKNLSRD